MSNFKKEVLELMTEYCEANHITLGTKEALKMIDKWDVLLDCYDAYTLAAIALDNPEHIVLTARTIDNIRSSYFPCC